ncbi:MAG TPA: M55 family metallopeptidase [Nannocystaceae bacterium]|nr:M55 family metallopeptidase [Nannocystaceae bacterium]
MRVYISVDMEGVAGIVHGDQTRRGTGEFASACELMTKEANAAALGAFEAGATEVLINDSHGDMRNLVLDQLDPRVQVLTGALKPYSMAEGLTGRERFDLALFVGYHGGAGTSAAILDHTYRGIVVYDVRIDGRTMNEASLNALVAGTAGTPVALVTGDASTCAQCRELLGDIETVEVKWALGRVAARSLHPVRARELIREAAKRVVSQPQRFRPYTLALPMVLELELMNTAITDAVAIIPGLQRTGARSVRYECADVDTMFRALMTIVRLGGTVA